MTTANPRTVANPRTIAKPRPAPPPFRLPDPPEDRYDEKMTGADRLGIAGSFHLGRVVILRCPYNRHSGESRNPAS